MRANPADYELIAPANLPAVLSLLAEQPGVWLPIAGGSDVMVQYSAGKLAARNLVSLWNLPELRRIDVTDDEVSIGAGCTYTDLRAHDVVEREFPLLARAAGWTGGIANQNRGTLGGNIVNASPAADSLPALLVYEAGLILISVRGERRVPYADFHTGYKKTLLAPDELIRAICLPRRFSGYIQYSRKVGARNAQAISKVCVAALGRLAGGVVDEVRIAAGSVAPVPVRLRKTEEAIQKKPLDAALLQTARQIAASEVQPIDDIRSTAAYRGAVLGNLVVEFLQSLRTETQRMKVLSRWNAHSTEGAIQEIAPCCGSQIWAERLVARRPFLSSPALIVASDEIWNQLDAADWLEAFSKHPRIGERKAPAIASSQSAAWSAREQRGVADSPEVMQSELAEANREYERRFGRIFIVCAAGKSAAEVLDILRRRLQNDEATELRIAAEEQLKITNLRLEKWLSQ
jgi:OHCU decarboxylase